MKKPSGHELFPMHVPSPSVTIWQVMGAQFFVDQICPEKLCVLVSLPNGAVPKLFPRFPVRPRCLPTPRGALPKLFARFLVLPRCMLAPSSEALKLTSTRASRHSHIFFNISSCKSAPELVCFVRFDFDVCFAPQRRAIFAHRNFQK